MIIERTNFDADWSEICSFCGKPQETHKMELGEFEGVFYEHRMPCEPEQDKMRKEQAKLVRMGNNLVAGIYTAEYVAGKIKGMFPMWDEIQLLRKLLKIKSGK